MVLSALFKKFFLIKGIALLQGWFPEALSLTARKIDELFWFATAWTGATCILVMGLLAFFIVRYRRKVHPKSFYTHGNSRGALILTLSLALVVFIALDINLAYQDHKVWEMMFGNPPSSEEALKVEVFSEQFAWNIRYAGADGVFNTDDDIVTINEMRVPVNKPVIVQLMSKDVIHSFFLPNLRIKQDVVPGMRTSIYFQSDKTGKFNIACAEHCGLGHYRMRGDFLVEEQNDFDAWLVSQSTEAAVAKWGWDWHGRTQG